MILFDILIFLAAWYIVGISLCFSTTTLIHGMKKEDLIFAFKFGGFVGPIWIIPLIIVVFLDIKDSIYILFK